METIESAREAGAAQFFFPNPKIRLGPSSRRIGSGITPGCCYGARILGFSRFPKISEDCKIFKVRRGEAREAVCAARRAAVAFPKVTSTSGMPPVVFIPTAVAAGGPQADFGIWVFFSKK